MRPFLSILCWFCFVFLRIDDEIAGKGITCKKRILCRFSFGTFLHLFFKNIYMIVGDVVSGSAKCAIRNSLSCILFMLVFCVFRTNWWHFMRFEFYNPLSDDLKMIYKFVARKNVLLCMKISGRYFLSYYQKRCSLAYSAFLRPLLDHVDEHFS